MKSVSVPVKVPAKPEKAVVKKVELRKISLPDPKHPGKMITKEIKVTRAFKKIRQVVPDPLNPGKVHVIDVKVETKAPPPSRAEKLEKEAKRLEKVILKKSEKIDKLKGGIKIARRLRKVVPILEDGAPAPPDPQQVKMAQDLYKLLDATVMHKARQIGQRYLEAARDQIILADANHESVQDFNIKMNEELVMPNAPEA